LYKDINKNMQKIKKGISVKGLALRACGGNPKP